MGPNADGESGGGSRLKAERLERRCFWDERQALMLFHDHVAQGKRSETSQSVPEQHGTYI